jgi:signal transduction histidine kinase
MTERNNKLDDISHQINDNILAVKGTLELMDTSVTEDDLHDLLLKAMQRMDSIQRLSNDMLDALQNCLNKMGSSNK